MAGVAIAMAAYVTIDDEITDPALFEEYRRLSGPAMAKFHPKFLVRGGNIDIRGRWVESEAPGRA